MLFFSIYTFPFLGLHRGQVKFSSLKSFTSWGKNGRHLLRRWPATVACPHQCGKGHLPPSAHVWCISRCPCHICVRIILTYSWYVLLIRTCKKKRKETVVKQLLIYVKQPLLIIVWILYFFSNLGRDSMAHLHQLYFNYFDNNLFAFTP